MTTYTPNGSIKLSDISTKQQIRLGIQGFPGVGKTWAALTFLNPVVIDFDRGLKAHEGRDDVIQVPAYSWKLDERKDKLIEWINKEGVQLTKDQTLILDGLSSLEVSYHKWFAANQHNFLTKGGKVDDFAEYRVKKDWCGELFEAIKTLRCDFILLSHESERADKPSSPGQPGSYTGKIRPLLTGSYGDMIVRDFSDWFRGHCGDKPKDMKEFCTPERLKQWVMNNAIEFKAMCDTFPRDTIYYWQLESDDKFDAKAGSLVNPPRFIPANWTYFKKYLRHKG